MQAEVTATKHKDVKGKELNYLLIKKGETTVYIRIGEENYLALKELEKIQELPLNTNNAKATIS